MKVTHGFLVLDANILIRDWWWQGRAFSILEQQALFRHRLVIPEIALAEAVHKLEEQIIKTITILKETDITSDKYDKYLSKLRQIAGAQEISGDFEDGCFTENVVTRYRNFIRAKISAYEGLVPEIPEISARILVERSIKAKRPFSKKDKGLRDTLIWFSILSLLQENPCVSLVSENIGDFADGQGNLHPDLVQESKEALPTGYELLFFKDLRDFISTFHEDTLFAVRLALLDGSYPHFNIKEWVQERLAEELYYCELDCVAWVGVPEYAEDPCLREVEEVIGYEVTCKAGGDTEVLIYSAISIIGLFDVTIIYASCSDIISHIQIIESDEDDDLFTSSIIRVSASLMLKFKFDLLKRQLVSVEPCAIHHDYQAAIDYLDEECEV